MAHGDTIVTRIAVLRDNPFLHRIDVGREHGEAARAQSIDQLVHGKYSGRTRHSEALGHDLAQTVVLIET